MTWYAGNNSTNNGSLGWIFASGTTSQTLLPGLYTNTQTFYSPTVTTTVTLLPGLYTNTQTFYSATVSASNTLLPALYTNTQTFYSPTVTTTVTLLPGLYTNAQTFYSPTVAIVSDIRPALYTNEQVFFPALIYNLYPDPSQVLAGVVYGPGGMFVGTLTLNPPEPRISLRTFTGRF
jgi:hypothetical protein